MAGTYRTRVLIVGAGVSGLGMAIRLKRRGEEDFVVLERGPDVGGTWRDNTYPGAACDIPSHLYSYSFEPRTDWSRAYPRQDEIQAYLQQAARANDVHRHLRIDTLATAARFDEATALWHVTTDGGDEYVADALVSALGFLREPAYPPIPGRETFAGPQIHTSRWDHDIDLRGRRVGVIGTGASAVQVVPELAGVAERLHVFQRTPAWIIPRRDRAYTRLEKAMFAKVPGARAVNRALIYLRKEVRFLGFTRDNPGMRLMAMRSRAHLRSQIPDPAMREALTPDYQMGCKRVLISNDFYPALARPDTELVTEPIREITPRGVLVGTEHREIELDALVYGTGFAVDQMLGPLTVTGLGGRDLHETWRDRPAAYLGTTVPGFPNLFVLLGPNTGLGHNSMIFMVESQIAYVLDALDRLADPELAWVDVDEDVLAGYVDAVDERSAGLVWATGCSSWYVDAAGRNYTLWPGFTAEYRWRTRRFDPRPYRAKPARELGRTAPERTDPRAHHHVERTTP
jgi:cation diffusion facilitator CzcD-associated flavoprotein CzcO